MPRLNGKFVSQAAYDAATTQKETPAVSTETETNPRNVSPLVLATREITKAKARLDKAEAAAQKVEDVHTELEEARDAYEAARDVLNDLL